MANLVVGDALALSATKLEEQLAPVPLSYAYLADLLSGGGPTVSTLNPLHALRRAASLRHFAPSGRRAGRTREQPPLVFSSSPLAARIREDRHSQIYRWPRCPCSYQPKPKNVVTFVTEYDVLQAGSSKAKNCQ